MQAWDRQPFDTDQSWPYFQAYRDGIRPRNLTRLRLAVPGTIAQPLQQLMEWCTEHFWIDRAKAWDVHLDTIKQHEIEAHTAATAKELAVRDEAMLEMTRTLVEVETEKMLATALQSDAETLKPGVVNAMRKDVITLGRLTRGESTENVQTYDLSSLTYEELKQLEAMRDRVRGK